MLICNTRTVLYKSLSILSVARFCAAQRNVNKSTSVKMKEILLSKKTKLTLARKAIKLHDRFMTATMMTKEKKIQ